jgi:hypothetical protein
MPPNCLLPARLLPAFLTILGLGCGDQSPPTAPDGAPTFAKGSAGGVSVTTADPAFGRQGTAGLLVRVLGSGFDQGSRASWERGGAPDPQITVNSTVFVSSSELRANIDIANDADIDLYDVAVYTAGGRKGIGTEKFEVTTATVISDPADYTVARGISDAGLVVGGTGDNAFFDTGERAFLWSPIGGFEVFDQNGGGRLGDRPGRHDDRRPCR